MMHLIAEHGVTAICIAIMLEELGVPMPIPTDVLIMFAGIASGRNLTAALVWFVVLSVASAIGSSGLYVATRRGGRPLVDRFGRYVHLGPAQLNRAESLLTRSGWPGIAAGRAIPGLRYATVISCGILKISYPRFITAHLAGSSVYIIVFLILGAIFGPAVVEHFHMLTLGFHILWLLLLAAGLPLLTIWCAWRAHLRSQADPSRWRYHIAMLLASCAGAISLNATWTTASVVGALLDPRSPLNAVQAPVRGLVDRGINASMVHILIYIGTFLAGLGVGVLYYEFILPRLERSATPLSRQAVELAVLSAVANGVFIALALPRGPLPQWLRTDNLVLFCVLILSAIGFAVATCYGRTLAMAVLPSWRGGPRPSEEGAMESRPRVSALSEKRDSSLH